MVSLSADGLFRTKDLKGRFPFDENASNLTLIRLTTVVRADVEQRLVFEFGWAVTEHVIGSPQGDALQLQPADQVDQFTGTHKRIAAYIPETQRHGTGEKSYRYFILARVKS